MTDYFIWNGVDCRTKGIHVSELPPITIPLERSKQTNVPGRPGSLTQLEGDDVYDDMILTATCFIADPEQIPVIAAWLKGKGTVTFANRTGGHYNARIANWYKDNISDVTITTSGSTITNPGSVYSEPLITLTGSGDITLMVGTTIVELTDITTGIVLDCSLKEAYLGTALMNDHMSGDFPVLKPGLNAISWTGNVTSIVISPRWRFL